MNAICFLGGVGIQELVLLLLFLFFVIGIPVGLIILIVRLVSRKNTDKVSPTNNDSQTTLLKHADKLIELKSLHERGIITQDEFEIEKRKILGQ